MTNTVKYVDYTQNKKLGKTAEFDNAKGIAYIYEKTQEGWNMTYSTDQGTHIRFTGAREGESIFLTESAPRVLLFSQPEDYVFFQREGVVYAAVENH